MRVIIWLILLSVLAVVAASVFGHNDGLVSIVWQGWRIDFSLNLFVVGLVATCLLVVLLLQTLRGLLNLPVRAQQWRLKQRDQAAQSALREALLSFFAGRYARSRQAAEKAIQIQEDTPDFPADHGFSALSHLISAVSLHRLRDTHHRDAHLTLAQKISRKSNKLKAAEEGAALLKAEFAIDDLDPAKALQILRSMPQGLSRRTQALRLKMRAAKAAGQPIDALRATRLLAKHKGFSPAVAQGLIRRLCKPIGHNWNPMRN
jgi:HemY protein